MVWNLQYNESGGETANEQQYAAQRLEIDTRESGEERVKKDDQTTDSNEHGRPEWNGSRSPEGHSNQCRT
jgi:hypothetical protein